MHDAWPSPALVHLYTFWGLLPLTEFCPVQKSLYVQVLRSPILAALLHGTPAAGISQTLRRGLRRGTKRNGTTELSQRAPPIFGWAAITLGIRPGPVVILFLVLFITFSVFFWFRAAYKAGFIPVSLWAYKNSLSYRIVKTILLRSYDSRRQTVVASLVFAV